MKIKFGNNDSYQLCCSYYVPGAFHTLSHLILPKSHVPIHSFDRKFVPFYQPSLLPPLSRPWQTPFYSLYLRVQLFSSWCHVAMQISVKDVKQLVLRYLALHCPLVLSTDFTASRQLKSLHCLPPIQSVYSSVNSWVFLIVLILEGS